MWGGVDDEALDEGVLGVSHGGCAGVVENVRALIGPCHLLLPLCHSNEGGVHVLDAACDGIAGTKHRLLFPHQLERETEDSVCVCECECVCVCVCVCVCECECVCVCVCV